MFISYPKIHRLGKEETEGMLDHTVIIQEKIDGANASIWLEDGKTHCGSRKRVLTEGFNGFYEYATTNKEIQKLLADHPEYRLCGEWLVRHTISYNENSYRKFYLFDIMIDEVMISPLAANKIAKQYNIPHPQIFGAGRFTEEEIRSYVGKTELGENGEGVVIKSKDFINKFEDPCYAKIVTQTFKEDNAITFGGNNKYSETYEEMYLVNKYCTLPRVQKIMHKIQPTLDRKLDLPHIPRVAETCYHDMIVEEAWTIAKRAKVIDFRQLKKLSYKKFIQIYKDIILGVTSVADRDNQ